MDTEIDILCREMRSSEKNPNQTFKPRHSRISQIVNTPTAFLPWCSVHWEAEGDWGHTEFCLHCFNTMLFYCYPFADVANYHFSLHQSNMDIGARFCTVIFTRELRTVTRGIMHTYKTHIRQCHNHGKKENFLLIQVIRGKKCQITFDTKYIVGVKCNT